MLLRDDRQMAIARVETLCIEAADRYASAAEKAQTPALAGLFNELARQHRRFVAALAPQIRAIDDLPQLPDPDKETIEDMFTDVKSWLRGDVHGTLIEERERGEDALADATRAALAHELPAEMRGLLQEILAHAEAARGRLADARAGRL